MQMNSSKMWEKEKMSSVMRVMFRFHRMKILQKNMPLNAKIVELFLFMKENETITCYL